MDFSGFMNGIVSFAQSHTAIMIVLGLVFLFFMYRKPKLFLSLLFLTLFLGGVYYMIMNMAGSGSEQKKRLVHEEKGQFENSP